MNSVYLVAALWQLESVYDCVASLILHPPNRNAEIRFLTSTSYEKPLSTSVSHIWARCLRRRRTVETNAKFSRYTAVRWLTVSSESFRLRWLRGIIHEQTLSSLLSERVLATRVAGGSLRRQKIWSISHRKSVNRIKHHLQIINIIVDDSQLALLIFLICELRNSIRK